MIMVTGYSSCNDNKTLKIDNNDNCEDNNKNGYSDKNTLDIFKL